MHKGTVQAALGRCRRCQAPGSEDLSQHLAWSVPMGQLVPSWMIGMPDTRCPSHWLVTPSHTTVLWWVLSCSHAVSSEQPVGRWELRTHIWLLLSRDQQEEPQPCLDVIDSKVDRCPGKPHLLRLGAPPSPPAGQPPWSGVQACGT